MDIKADNSRKSQFIMQKHENSKSVEELLHLKDFKKACKTCKQADEYLIIKAKEEQKKKLNLLFPLRRQSLDQCSAEHDDTC